MLCRRSSLTRKAGAFARDRRGATAILTAIVAMALMGFTAIGVDLGSLFVQKRRQQTANDLAALAAASDLARPDAAARASLTRNQTASNASVLVETGIYTGNAALTPAQRFVVATGPSVNAARVSVQSTTPLYFGRVFSLFRTTPAVAADNRSVSDRSNSVALRTSAIAATNAQAAFSVGSRLLAVNGGIANAVLGGLLGTTLSLTVMDYQALADARIDMFTLSEKLATRLNLTAVNYSQILSRTAYTSDVLQAALEAARANPANSGQANAALAQIAATKIGSFTRMDLTPLMATGVYATRQPEQGAPLSASIGALSLVSAIAQMSNGSSQVNAALAVSLPGVASANLAMTIGERPVSRPLVNVGSVGATAYTAQTRLLLNIALIGSGVAPLIQTPIYLEIANAQARLAAITCAPGNISSSSVTLGVTPGIVDAWIGSVGTNEMTNFATKPNPGPATLVNVGGLLTVTGRAHAGIGNMTETAVTFSYADIAARTVKTTSTSNIVTPLLLSLVGDLRVQVNVIGGLGLGAPGLDGVVLSTIASATNSIDTILSGVLSALGIGLGQADTWVSDVRCGSAVLVN